MTDPSLTLYALPSSGNIYKVRLLLALMSDALAASAQQGRDWFCGAAPSIADIALCGDTCTAGTRGGYDMARFAAIDAWCARIAALPGYITWEHQP
ncbi:MAG: glutathione S-transferase family protein [Rhodobacterales bacterium]